MARKKAKSSPKKKKATRRSKVKYAALTPKYNSKIRQEYLDYDYIDKLSPEEKDWLAAFNSEYANNDFKHGFDPVIRKTKKNKKKSGDANNARNRCAYGISKATTLLNMVPQEQVNNFFGESRDMSKNETEDALIEYLNEKDKRERRSKW